MKKTIIFCMAAVLLFGCSVKTEEKENYSDEMKIAHTVDLSEDDGADSVEREGDQKESPYFKHPGIQNFTQNHISRYAQCIEYLYKCFK